MFAEAFKGTEQECNEYVRGWIRPTRKIGVPSWTIKRDGIAKTETGEQRFLVLTDRETGADSNMTTRITSHNETAELEEWGDGTYAILLDGERIATIDNQEDATELFQSL